MVVSRGTRWLNLHPAWWYPTSELCSGLCSSFTRTDSRLVINLLARWT